jgi:hypothetical protein
MLPVGSLISLASSSVSWYAQGSVSGGPKKDGLRHMADTESRASLLLGRIDVEE